MGIYAVAHRVSDKRGISLKTVRIGCVTLSLIVLGLVTRVAYGQGMFSFRYYEYGSMYFWAVMFIAVSTIVSLVYIFAKEENRTPVTGPELDHHHKKILAIIVLVVTYITCLGSNNAMYPIVNNLFIVAPYTLWCIYEWLKMVYSDKNKTSWISAVRFGGGITVVVISAALMFQGVIFHSSFALQDGDDGQERTAMISDYSKTNHIYTTQSNALAIQGVMDYMEANAQNVDEVVLFGDVPGFGYLCNKSSALTTFWPDLNSYTYDEWTTDMRAVELQIEGGRTAPYIITSIQVAAWEGGDPEAMAYFGIDTEEYEANQKLNDLVEFMSDFGYSQVYCNDAYSVYYIK